MIDTTLTRTYLGDGLYADFDGFHIRLMANGYGPGATDTVYLEPEALLALQQWIAAGHRDHVTGRTFKDTFDLERRQKRHAGDT